MLAYFRRLIALLLSFFTALSALFGANAATLIRGSSITCGGKKKDIPFTVRAFAYNDFTDTALTLDTGAITFKKGDTIHLDLILLPWGTGLETTTDNVKTVLEDSCLNRLAVTRANGAIVDDPLVPTVYCTDNTAEFSGVKTGIENMNQEVFV